MAKFVPNQDTTVEADEPLLEVVADGDSRLAPGKHVFQLVVTDDAGNQSAPASVTVIVADAERPTAVIDLIDETGARNPAPEVTVASGRPFTLTAERSTDVGGQVRRFAWSLLRA